MAAAPPRILNTATMPNLFVDSNHQPLNVFVDASGVQRRPKLIRTLRNSGAKVCLIGEARILLVDPESTSGKNYIRDWANDANKIVLTASWVQKCLDKGRALLDADNWGGCVAEDDGQPIMSDGDQDEEAEAGAEPEPEETPLPTPRPTPAGMSNGVQKRHSRPSLSQPAGSEARPRSSHPPSFSQGSFRQPEVNYTPTASGSNTASQMPMQLQGASFTQNAPPPQMQLQMQPQLQQQLMPHANMMSMLPYLYPNLPNLMQYPTQNPLPVLTTLVETAIAVSRNNGLDATLLQAALTSLPMYQSQAPQTPTQQPGGQQVGQNFFPAASGHPLNGAADLAQSPNRASPTTPEEPISRPPKRKSHPSSGNDPQSSQSAKMRLRKVAASSMAGTSLRPRSSQAAATPSRSQVVATPSRPPSVNFLTQPPLSQGRHRERSGGVFANPPQPFFVQIDIRNRRDIVQAIKRNGGTLSFEISQSNYAVLNPRSTTFKDLASDARRFEVPIVQPAFVDASVAHGELVDPEPYILEAPVPPKKQTKKKARRSPPIDPIDSFSRLEVPKQEPSVEGSSRSGTPDVPPNREQMMSGKFAFTEEEWDFCWQYARRLLEHDPDISSSVLGQKVHEKLPHHSLLSWQSSIHKRKHLLNEIREEVLASRGDPVNDSAGPSAQEQENREDIEELDDEDSTKVDCAELRAPSDVLDEASAMATLVTNATDDQFREDFETIVSLIFTADWEGVPDTEIWARMAAERSCRSAPDWDQFLDEHHEAVTSEVERRSLEAAQTQAAAEAQRNTQGVA